MERENIGLRVRRIAASSAGFLTAAALVTATIYPSATLSKASAPAPYLLSISSEGRESNYFYTTGRLTGKMELTCIPNTKTYDLELCNSYIEELLNFVSGNNPTLEIKDKSPKPNPEPADKKYTCLDCHARYNRPSRYNQ